eukprot:scaffold198760_cov28-Tisochrysis_lutea.AAC.5
MARQWLHVAPTRAMLRQLHQNDGDGGRSGRAIQRAMRAMCAHATVRVLASIVATAPPFDGWPRSKR